MRDQIGESSPFALIRSEDVTRAQLLKEAAKALRVEGPHRLGVANVMARAGLTHGGFYAHFGSKDDLIAAAIARAVDETQAAFDRVTADKPPAQALQAYVKFYLSNAHRNAVEIGCPLPSLAADSTRITAAARRQFTSGLSELTAAMGHLLAAAGHPDADSLASSLLAEMVGALALARAVTDPHRSDAILRASRQSLMRRL